MIKDKLHTLTDEQATEVALILLKSFLPYKYDVIKISRNKWDIMDGVDIEESINVYFKSTVVDEHYRNAKWKDKEILVQLIEKDRYHEYPYFYAASRDTDSAVKGFFRHEFLANQIEAVEYLQKLNVI